METDLLWVFLFAALSIGWMLGYHSKSIKKRPPSDYQEPPDIKHRLQLLFDSYADDSIDGFVQSLEVRPETLGIHISIGKHFRARGEVEKAILIHQNLMAHPELSSKASEAIVFELAKDYQVAGLLDRAESLLKQLSGSKQFALKSQKRLLDIYEHEKDWALAVEHGLKSSELKKNSGTAMRVAQYCCEMADEHLKENSIRDAVEKFEQAMAIDRSCIRAMLGSARLKVVNKEYELALNLLRKVPEVSPENTLLILPELLACTIETNSFDQHQKYLHYLLDETGQVPILLAIVESMLIQGDSERAIKFLLQRVKRSPSISSLDFAMNRLEMSQSDKADVLELIPGMLKKVRNDQVNYRCVQCGFSVTRLHWKCPSCKGWQSIKPVIEYEASS